VRDEQLVIQIPALEIFVPGPGLLYEQYPLLRKSQSPLSVRRAFFFSITPKAGKIVLARRN
jgi:hypothetical protein